MNNYTTIFFDWNVYGLNKHKLQNLRIRFNVKWNDKKLVEGISYSDIVSIYRLFKSENRIIHDNNLMNRSGATGQWSNETDTLKIVAFDSTDKNEGPPVLIIYRGVEGSFYRTLIKMCADIGCEISKLIEDENGISIIFKKQRTPDEIEKIRNLEGLKEPIIREFNGRIMELKNRGIELSNKFVDEWRRCVESYGYYDIRMLMKGEKNGR